MWIDRIKSRLSGLIGEDAKIIPRLLLTEGRRHAKGYALAIFFMFLVAFSTSMTAYMIKEIVNGIFVNQTYYLVWLLSAAIVTIYTVKGLAAYGEAVTMAYVGNRIVSDFRKRMYDCMLAQGVAYFAARHSTDFMNRLSFGANGARQVLDLVITSLGRDVFTLIGLIVVMMSQDPVVTLLGLTTLPIAVLFVRKMVSRARKIVQREFGGLGEMLQTMQETAQGVRIVKSYGLENRLRDRFHGSVQSAEAAANKMARVGARASPLMESLGGFAIAASVAYTGHNVLASGKTPGEFAAVLTALILCYEPAKRLARLNIDLSSALAGVRLLYDILDSVPAEREEAGLPDLAVTRGRVEFRDVVFAYRKVETVLQGVSFAAEPGQTTALVGPSGGGKTTIIKKSDRALLRAAVGRNPYRRPADRLFHAPLAARCDRLCEPRRLSVFRHRARQHRFRKTRCVRGRDRRRGQGRLCARLHPGLREGLRRASRRARIAALRRPAGAHRHRPRLSEERTPSCYSTSRPRRSTAKPSTRSSARSTSCAPRAPPS